MLQVSSIIWDLWRRGGPFVGDFAAHSRVTVEPDWALRVHNNAGSYSKLPVRFFQLASGNQIELEIENVVSIDIDRTVDADAGSCTIVLRNQKMNANLDNVSTASPDLGNPGYYSPQYQRSADAQARWLKAPNIWSGLLMPNALIRTYQGYGGHTKDIQQAVAAGDIYRTGTWLVDDVVIRTSGEMELRCRDMGKLLIEQPLFPPIVPNNLYPLEYSRWKYTTVQELITAGPTSSTTSQTPAPSQQIAEPPAGEKRIVYHKSGNNLNFVNGVIHGHAPEHAIDGDVDTTYWLSPGHATPTGGSVFEWIEFFCNETINAVFIHPYLGNYTMYVSIHDGANWLNEGGVIPYTPGPYTEATGFPAAIPYVFKAGVPFETSTTIRLNKSYTPHRIRFTFTSLAKTTLPGGAYRAGLRRVKLLYVSGNQVPASVTGTAENRLIWRMPDNSPVLYDPNDFRYADPARPANTPDSITTGFYPDPQNHLSTPPPGMPLRPEGWPNNWQVSPWRPTSGTRPLGGYFYEIQGPPGGQNFRYYLPMVWDSRLGYFVDVVTGRRAYYGPQGQPGASAHRTVTKRVDGNYKDYSEVVSDILRWCGWHLGGSNSPAVFGNIETTGIPGTPGEDDKSDYNLGVDVFDKRPAIDAINTLKEVVGYGFWIDEDGAAHFEAPNHFSAGNFYSNGARTTFIPEIDERQTLTDYTLTISDRSARSEIIIASEKVDFSNTPHSARYSMVPYTSSILRGISKPAMWVNAEFKTQREQQLMAQLIALHIYWSQRSGTVTCIANPAIQINDQVRILERQTGETYIHYVRGVRTFHNLDTGEYIMNLTTHWLGDGTAPFLGEEARSWVDFNGARTTSGIMLQQPFQGQTP